jgi:hypothetical protein
VLGVLESVEGQEHFQLRCTQRLAITLARMLTEDALITLLLKLPTPARVEGSPEVPSGEAKGEVETAT